MPLQAPDGQKAHEPQSWLQLEFDPAGKLLPLRWQDTLSLSVSATQPDHRGRAEPNHPAV